MSTKLTNNFDLPDAVFDAISNDSYRGGGDISVTALIDSPQIRSLKKQNNLEEDVTERVWALLGSAVHNILERANIKSVKRRAFLTVIDDLHERFKTIILESSSESDMAQKDAETLNKVAKWLFKYMQECFPELNERYLFEVRLFWNVNGMEISGQFDIYDKIDKVLYDYKVTSVYSYIFPESRKKWNAQLNIYAHMLEVNGHEVKEAFIVAIFRDWSKLRMLNEKDYPQRQIMKIPIQIIDRQALVKYVEKRVEIHAQADKGNVLPCSGQDRWATATQYACKARGKDRAVSGSRTDSYDQAIKFLNDNKHKYIGLYIETRPGENKRCDSYCPVREVCPQRKEMLEAQAKSKAENDG